MNDRIKELYLESLDENQNFCYQEFAKLIVRECAEFVRKQNYESMRNEESYNIASTDILKHFGVKE